VAVSERPQGPGLLDPPARAGYYLHGPERAWLRVYLPALRDRVAREAGSREAAPVVHVEGEDAWQRAAAEARRFGLERHRLVVARPTGVPERAAVTALAQALASPAPGVVLVVVEPEWSGRERPGARLAPLRKGPQALEMVPLDASRAGSFLLTYGRRLGLQVEPEAARELWVRTGETLETCLTELEKFAASLPTPVVTVDAVRTLTPAADEASVFPVGDAVLRGDVAGALAAAEQALARGQSAFGLVGYVARQVGLVAAVRRLEAEGPEDRSPEAVAGRLGIPPWQARKLLAAAHDPRTLRGGDTSAARAILDAQIALRTSVPERVVVTELLLALARTSGEKPGRDAVRDA